MAVGRKVAATVHVSVQWVPVFPEGVAVLAGVDPFLNVLPRNFPGRGS